MAERERIRSQRERLRQLDELERQEQELDKLIGQKTAKQGDQI